MGLLCAACQHRRPPSLPSEKPYQQSLIRHDMPASASEAAVAPAHQPGPLLPIMSGQRRWADSPLASAWTTTPAAYWFMPTATTLARLPNCKKHFT